MSLQVNSLIIFFPSSFELKNDGKIFEDVIFFAINWFFGYTYVLKKLLVRIYNIYEHFNLEPGNLNRRGQKIGKKGL